MHVHNSDEWILHMSVIIFKREYFSPGAQMFLKSISYVTPIWVTSTQIIFVYSLRNSINANSVRIGIFFIFIIWFRFIFIFQGDLDRQRLLGDRPRMVYESVLDEGLEGIEHQER